MSVTGPPAPPHRSRDPFLDNARGLLIVLVVVGHTLECFGALAGTLGSTLYTAVYSFHMAAFIMISGYLSRSYRSEPRQVRRLVTAMVLPYLIFQLVHEAGKALLLGQAVQLQLVLPAWTLWFLVALLVWRLLTPVLRRLRHPLVIAVAIAVIAPLDPDLGAVLSLGRIAQMLPFFVLGLVSTPRMLERLLAFRHRWWGGAVLAAALAVAFLVQGRLPASIFFLRGPYEGDVPLRLALQVVLLAVGVAGSLALLLVTPRGRSALSVVGERSLTVYLLHPVLLLPIRYAEHLPDWPASWWGTLALVLLGAVLAAVLAAGPVARAARWLTDPPVGRLLLRAEDEAPARPRS